MPVATILLAAILVVGCGKSDSSTPATQVTRHATADEVVNLYIWADYIAPDLLKSFEKETGVRVRQATFETNETLEARMLTGNSGYDLVVPTAPYFQRQIESGAYLPLDKTKLSNLKNLDPDIMARVALNDPGNAHGVVYAWGTFGLGYNQKKVSEVLPGVAIDSWRLIFDPAFASKLATCGINMLDAPAGIVRLVLKYLDRNPNAPSARDLADAQAVLLKVRPYIRNIDSSVGTDALANGDVCMALEYSGTVYLARHRAEDAHNGIKLDYVIPNEGSLLWFDMLAIPKDAPHPLNAHLLMNYLMTPQVAAMNSTLIGTASANAAAASFLDAAVIADPVVYPLPDQRQRLFVQTEDTPDQARAITRLWQKFKTGH